jgi:hypothetical protein
MGSCCAEYTAQRRHSDDGLPATPRMDLAETDRELGFLDLARCCPGGADLVHSQPVPLALHMPLGQDIGAPAMQLPASHLLSVFMPFAQLVPQSVPPIGNVHWPPSSQPAGCEQRPDPTLHLDAQQLPVPATPQNPEAHWLLAAQAEPGDFDPPPVLVVPVAPPVPPVPVVPVPAPVLPLSPDVVTGEPPELQADNTARTTATAANEVNRPMRAPPCSRWRVHREPSRTHWQLGAEHRASLELVFWAPAA